jgi:hypothetical protein
MNINCHFCGGGHPNHECQSMRLPQELFVEQVDYLGNGHQDNNPYGSTFNPCWRNHLNVSWSNQQRIAPPQGFACMNNV